MGFFDELIKTVNDVKDLGAELQQVKDEVISGVTGVVEEAKTVADQTVTDVKAVVQPLESNDSQDKAA